MPPTSTDKDDNTPLIVGVVVGSLLFLALVALIVFLVRRRNSKAESVAATPAQPGGMASARNEYGQLPGAKTYGDVTDVRAIAANSYGNVNVSPKGEYDAPDSTFKL